ncbi:hypothetical protein, partial [Chlamydia suis]|uniref:hypothetical protein n=1 Tax=Chlamydia suis TaxID=83559 RepID=UPI001CA4D276
IKLSFPIYSQKYFSCPTTPPQPVFSPPLNPIFFFFFPFLFQKNSPPSTLQTKIFLSHKRTIILACSNYGRSTSISFLEAGDPTS